MTYCSKYLDTTKQFYDTYLPPPPTRDEMAPVPPPDAEERKKLVLILHDNVSLVRIGTTLGMDN